MQGAGVAVKARNERVVVQFDRKFPATRHGPSEARTAGGLIVALHNHREWPVPGLVLHVKDGDVRVHAYSTGELSFD